MPALKIVNCRKVYANGTVGVDDISLTIESGDFFALLGLNGAGKTTLIGMITTLLTKTSGSIKIFDCDIDKNPSMAKLSIGIVPQEFNFNMFQTVLDNVLIPAGYYGIPRQEAKSRAEPIMKSLNLWDKRKNATRTLSGGMKRRLMIARALIHKPKLLILDEPTAGVDVDIRKETWSFLESLNRAGTTIILTTHYLEEAELLCKNLAIIDNGKIVTQGRMQDVLSSLQNQIYRLTTQGDLKKLSDLEKPIEFTLVDESTVDIRIPTDYALDKIFSQLLKFKIVVKHIEQKQHRLESIFLSHTGHNKHGEAK